MGNQFVNLPVPVGGNGVGAAVDVSTFGAVKTMLCGGDAQAQITIEVNNDVAQAGSWSALTTFQNTGQLTVRAAVRWMRVRVSNYNKYAGGQSVVDVGGTDDGSQFASLVAPVGNGVGGSVNTSALGLFKTVQVGGDFRGTVIVEVSEDGTEWAQPFSFTNAGGIQSAVIAAEFMRVRRVGVPQIAPGLPIVNIGATDDFQGDDGVAISAGTQSVATGTVDFANSNGVSFGMSASSRVTASMDAFRSVIGSGSTATGPTLSFANSNGVSFGISGQTVTASAAPGGGAAISAGTQSVSTGTINFANSNGITFGMSNSSQITASFSAPPAETPFGISAGTQSVSTGTINFADSNGVTFGMSNSSQITASVNTAGATISQFAPFVGKILAIQNLNNGSFWVAPYPLPYNLTFSQYNALVQHSANAASNGTISFSYLFGAYTKNGSTLSLAHSTSFSSSIPYATGGSSATYNGYRIAPVAWASSMSAGDYWFGIGISSTVSSDNGTIRLVYQDMGPAASGVTFSGILGSNSSVVTQMQLGLGGWSAATGAVPNSMAFSDIKNTSLMDRLTPAFGFGLSV